MESRKMHDAYFNQKVLLKLVKTLNGKGNTTVADAYGASLALLAVVSVEAGLKLDDVLTDLAYNWEFFTVNHSNIEKETIH